MDDETQMHRLGILNKSLHDMLSSDREAKGQLNIDLFQPEE